MQINGHFTQFLEDQCRYLINYGGAGSGKSVIAAQKIILRCLTEPGHLFLVMRKADTTNRNSTYANLLQQLATLDSNLYTAIRSPLEIRFTNGSKIIFGGLNSPAEVEKLKSINGVTGIWIEEATEITEDGFKQLNLRLRGNTHSYKQIILTFNPVSTFNWIYTYFFENTPADTNIYHSNYTHNPFIDSEYAKQLKHLKDIDLNYYSVYALGQWGQTQDTVYKLFQEAPLPQTYKTRIWGVDWGFNDPAVLLAIYIQDGNYYIDEVVYQSGLTQSQFIDIICNNVKGNELVYCDHNPGALKELQMRKILAQNADKNIENGVAHIKSIHNKIYTNKKNKNFARENALYTYATVSGRVTDKPADAHNHTMDALRYALYTYHKQYGYNVGPILIKNKK